MSACKQRVHSQLLGPVSLLDCLVFCLFLAPQLVLEAGLFSTLACGLQALPFLLVRLPLAVAAERCRPTWLRLRSSRSTPASPTLFQDLVVRCVRWGFVHIPPRVGRVFFSPAVALPFLRFRQLRHGCRYGYGSHSLLPLRWRELQGAGFRGLWIIHDPTTPPDIVVFFVHGGGFVLGSSHFYLEFLLSWATLLLAASPDGRRVFGNPAVFSLDYTLAPGAVFPAQLHEAAAAYAHVLAMVAAEDGRASPPVVVAGDSAGGTLVLSLLLHLAASTSAWPQPDKQLHHLGRPALAVLISPWVSLWSRRYQRSRTDYVDVATLAGFAEQYVGSASKSASSPQAAMLVPSPGDCRDAGWWRRASPTHGFLATYGEDEVFAPEIGAWAAALRGYGVPVQLLPDSGPGVHAWPVASLFLGSTEAQRLDGLLDIVKVMRQRLARARPCHQEGEPARRMSASD